MKWTRVPTPGSDAKLGSGKLELERAYTPQPQEGVVRGEHVQRGLRRPAAGDEPDHPHRIDQDRGAGDEERDPDGSAGPVDPLREPGARPPGGGRSPASNPAGGGEGEDQDPQPPEDVRPGPVDRRLQVGAALRVDPAWSLPYSRITAPATA